MDKYKIKLTPRAYKDLDDIYSYIAWEKLSPDNAKGQTECIKDKLNKLSLSPQSHQERTEGRYANCGYRQLLIDNYVAIFRIEESTKTVFIITIQYQGRNL